MPRDEDDVARERAARGRRSAVIERAVGRRPARYALLMLFAATFASSAATAAGADDALSFAIVAGVAAREQAVADTLRAIGVGTGGPPAFVVHFDRTPGSDASCGDAALERRRALLDAVPTAVVPIPAASEWIDCGGAGVDPVERLQRVGDALFAGPQSLGQTPLAWSHQSASPRFRRYRENVRWQVGPVVFATVDLPAGNNGYRLAAGRNGEFEERLIANRTWLERTFRLAVERKARGVVLFVDAAPGFDVPLRAPDLRSRERDGYYEWKLALREYAMTFNGVVLIVQGRAPADAKTDGTVDHPLRDSSGASLPRVARVAALEPNGESRWLRIDIDPKDPALFRVEVERAFDDPSGELYGPAPLR